MIIDLSHIKKHQSIIIGIHQSVNGTFTVVCEKSPLEGKVTRCIDQCQLTEEELIALIQKALSGK